MGVSPAGGNPFHKLDRQSVIGALKSTGSNDPDVLYAKKQELAAANKHLRLVSYIAMPFGVLLTIMLITAVFGIPFFFFGLWLWYFSKKNLAVVDGAYNEYLSTIPASA